MGDKTLWLQPPISIFTIWTSKTFVSDYKHSERKENQFGLKYSEILLSKEKKCREHLNTETGLYHVYDRMFIM